MTARPASVREALGLGLVVALAEEALFRGLLTPARADTPTRRLATAASIAGFVAWHVLQGLVAPPT